MIPLVPVAVVLGKAALVGAAQGAIAGGAIGAIGGTVTGAHKKGSVEGALYGALHGTFRGAASGAAFGAVFGVAGAAFHLVKNAHYARDFQKLAQTVHPQGYVYVMENAHSPGVYKIGRTINPARRLSQVQRQVGGALKYVGLRQTANAPALEATLHHAHHGSRKFGEWFALNGAQVLAICSDYAAKGFMGITGGAIGAVRQQEHRWASDE